MTHNKNSRIQTIFRKTPLILLAALPLTVGAVLAQQTAPATPAQTQQTQAQQAQPQQTQPKTTQQARTNYADAYLQKLAAQLGISVDKLKAAGLAAGNATIDQGVKDGNIAANRAADMKTRLKDNPFGMLRGGPDGGRGMHGPGGRGGGPRGQMEAPNGPQGQLDDGAGAAEGGN
ncbi:hypothetical protein [Deinococcus arenicola]|uniref:Uncharacterized protein n=1 Tax=Deinococcus arenicola TaxID=2994950 RepID=A0ABU4DNB8_9DEIO|nr:hypothetical protein [Deinococcus sp. ZS9-10]MDV6373930.1 hypothetical protein [Deinococcus sp. ZS9-10]